MNRSDFGSQFTFGVATAAYQIEGAYQQDGKGESIWDRFTQKPKAIFENANANTTCDHYHLYPKDIGIMRELGIQANRFSLSWTRILPQGIGKPNQAGIDFYHRVIDTCLEAGIEPWITLYHWDLPQALEDKGGWTNREILNWFTEYCDVCTRAFGGKVSRWMILNEPMAFVGLGYLLGIHAPGRKGFLNFLPAALHATLAMGMGAEVVRKNVPQSTVGTTFSCTYAQPYSNSRWDIGAAKRYDAALNRLFLDPICGKGFPTDVIWSLKAIYRYFKPDDEKRLPVNFDFIGLQNYTRDLVKFSLFDPLVWFKGLSGKDRGVEHTEMGWEIYPEGIYHLLKQFAQMPNVREIIVTENGSAFPDVVQNGRVYDEKRVRFLQQYLAQVLRAKQEGVPVSGYFVWSFLDNFEWAEGYRPRFGLVHVDYQTQQRTIKDSGFWYRDFIKG